MSNKKDLIKEIIDYLDDVSNGEKIGGKNQGFFVSTKELDKILKKYFLFFKDKSELIRAVKHNYYLIKEMSFPYEKGVYMLFAKDLSVDNTVFYSDEQHMYYAHTIHSHLITAFEAKLGVKEKKARNRITVKNNNVKGILESLNLEVEFLREGLTSEDFLSALINPSSKPIYLIIDNRSFHYLLSRIESYFYNFTISDVARTNKIYSSQGTVMTAKNLLASKAYHPKHKDAIDAVFKKHA